MSLKEMEIRNYLSKVDFSKDWNYNTIEESMRTFLGERPALEVTYVKDVMLNETTSEAKEFLKIDKIAVYFTDLDDKPKKIFIKK